MFHIAQSFGVSEPTVCRTIKRVEDVLLQSGAFTLPDKKAWRNRIPLWRLSSWMRWMRVNRRLNAQKRQRDFYSGKKKCHTLKS
jgi:hypothetical protein